MSSIERKHIVIITNLFPNSQEKEKGQFIFQFVEELKKHIRLTVVSPIPYYPTSPIFNKHDLYKFSQLKDIEQQNGYDVHFCRHFVIPKLGFVRAASLYRPLLRKLREIDRSCKIDLINAHWIFPDGVAAERAGKILGIPVVLSARGCDINCYPYLFARKRQIVSALSSCSVITAVSHDLKKNIASLGLPQDKIKFIPNGIDMKKFTHLDQLLCRRQLQVNADDRIILFVGSLDEVKGAHLLVRAFAGIANGAMPHNIRLWIVGDGYLRQELEDLGKSFGVDKSIRFWGNQPHDNLPAIMSAANLLCVPSIREGRPNVVLESLACGVPVVGSNVGGIPELVLPDVNGYIFEKENVAELSERIQLALSRHWNRTDISSTVSHFSWVECVAKYMNIFSKLLI